MRFNLGSQLTRNPLVTRSKVSASKAKNSPCNQNEWEIILSSILLGQKSESAKGLLEDVEAVAAVDDEKSITLTIRKRVEGITASH
jgi:hypothetical protein